MESHCSVHGCLQLKEYLYHLLALTNELGTGALGKADRVFQTFYTEAIEGARTGPRELPLDPGKRSPCSGL